MKTELKKTEHSQWQCAFFLDKYGWMNKIHEIQIYAFQNSYNYPICASAVLRKYFYVFKSFDSTSEQQSFVATLT